MRPLSFEVARSEELSRARHTIDSYLMAQHVELQMRRDIVLCASEAIANALLHSGNDPAQPVIVEATTGPTIVVVVTDFGRWKQESPGHVGRGLTNCSIACNNVRDPLR